ncbi:hypothetical protein ACGFX2_32810 [Streptomyces goshikiensis]|uniref:hypothetical protein n=1 Tax=Streptomyces goshikiensis TaxID=1942 RepID=UPI00371D4B47
MSDLPTTAEERLSRLRAQLSGVRSGTRADRGLRLSRGGNALIGASLHAAARKDAGMELTGLEQLLVGAMGAVVSEEEVAAFGRVYLEEASRAGAKDLFPDVLASRPLEEGYRIEDLVGDLPAFGVEIAAQPNTSVVRLDELSPDEPLDSTEFVEALGLYGGGVTVVHGPREAAPRGADGADADYVLLSYRDFSCLRRSGEAGKTRSTGRRRPAATPATRRSTSHPNSVRSSPAATGSSRQSRMCSAATWTSG